MYTSELKHSVCNDILQQLANVLIVQ